MVIESRCAGPRPVFLLTPAGHGDERGAGDPGKTLQLRCELVTAHPRHADIQQQQLRVKVPEAMGSACAPE